MYQEIGLDNKLLSICRKCGKTIKKKVSFNGGLIDKDQAEETNLDIENFNAKLSGKEKDETL
jgi:hypothetical protein